MRDLNSLVMEAKTDQQILEDLIIQNEYFVLKCTSKFTYRYITKSDDEWSIALLAFKQAIDRYDLNKGNFLSFAELIIKRRLIDYAKSQGKYSPEYLVDPIVFNTEPEDENEDTSIRMAVAKQVTKNDTEDLKAEIEEINEILSSYGFSFFELSKCSPHSYKTKKTCAKSINYMLSNSLLIKEMKSTKLLPIKIIEKNTRIPRKIIERHRKYIIAAIEILFGRYPLLAEYLRYIREENEE